MTELQYDEEGKPCAFRLAVTSEKNVTGYVNNVLYRQINKTSETGVFTLTNGRPDVELSADVEQTVISAGGKKATETATVTETIKPAEGEQYRMTITNKNRNGALTSLEGDLWFDTRLFPSDAVYEAAKATCDPAFVIPVDHNFSKNYYRVTDAVVEYVRKEIAHQIRDLGNGIKSAEIQRISSCETRLTGYNNGFYPCIFEYCLVPTDPEYVILDGKMRLENGVLTECGEKRMLILFLEYDNEANAYDREWTTLGTMDIEGADLTAYEKMSYTKKRSLRDSAAQELYKEVHGKEWEGHSAP